MGQKMVSAGNLSRIWGKVKELVKSSLSAATQQADGLMTAADKRKLDQIGTDKVLTGSGSTSYEIQFPSGAVTLLYVKKSNARSGDTWLIAGDKVLPIGSPAVSTVSLTPQAESLLIRATGTDGQTIDYSLAYLVTSK